MFLTKLLATIWLLGGVYILVASRFSPRWFGGITATLAIPAGLGILIRRRWAIVPSLLLCVAWIGFALFFITRGSGTTLNNLSLLIAGVTCGVMTAHWYHRRFRSKSGLQRI